MVDGAGGRRDQLVPGWSGIRSSIQWLLYSQFAVMLVLAYVVILFVALPIFVSLDNLDPGPAPGAARSWFRAPGRWRTFARVTLPLSVPSARMAAFVFKC